MVRELDPPNMYSTSPLLVPRRIHDDEPDMRDAGDDSVVYTPRRPIEDGK